MLNLFRRIVLKKSFDSMKFMLDFMLDFQIIFLLSQILRKVKIRFLFYVCSCPVSRINSMIILMGVATLSNAECSAGALLNLELIVLRREISSD